MEASRTFARPGNDGTETRAFAAQLRVYTETSMMIAVATGIGVLMAPALGASAIDLLYLLPVMAAATLYGLRPGLFAGAASALAYNFFFTEPVHSLRVADPRNVVTVAMLFAVAVVTSQLAARVRAQADLAQRSATQNSALAGFAR
ncbi:MAG: DUF4118 domain-containing protein, partial [Sphingomonadaceae bacterium]|nr:DUF4118 domain-containing protein [Sphingomonadaceae bacterium]